MKRMIIVILALCLIAVPIGFAVSQNQRLAEASAYLDSQTLALLNGTASALDSMMTADSLHDADRFAACYMRYIQKLGRMKQALAMTDDLLDLSSTYENAVAYLLSLSDDIEGKTPDAFYEEFQWENYGETVKLLHVRASSLVELLSRIETELTT